MLLENNTNYSHLQRSIDTLRSLGDRLNERNVDLRLNLHQDLRNNSDRNGLNAYDRTSLNLDRNLNMDRNLELNLSLERSLNNDRNILAERMQQERNLNLERLINERNLDHRNLNLEHSLSIERLNLERSLAQTDRALTDRNLNNVERMTLDRNLSNNDRNNDRLRGLDLQNDLRHQDINDLKYREYKAHLDTLRNTESSRTIEGRPDEERGTPSTPPTPLSVGENFQEEKVFFICCYFST